MFRKRLLIGSTYLFISYIRQPAANRQIAIRDTTISSDTTNNWISLQEKESIGGYTKINGHIFGGEIACNVKPLENIDVETFKVLAGINNIACNKSRMQGKAIRYTDYNST